MVEWWHVLIELTKIGKSPRSIARLPYASFTNFYVNKNYEVISDTSLTQNWPSFTQRFISVEALIQAPDITTALGLRGCLKCFMHVVYAFLS